MDDAVSEDRVYEALLPELCKDAAGGPPGFLAVAGSVAGVRERCEKVLVFGLVEVAQGEAVAGDARERVGRPHHFECFDFLGCHNRFFVRSRNIHDSASSSLFVLLYPIRIVLRDYCSIPKDNSVIIL